MAVEGRASTGSARMSAVVVGLGTVDPSLVTGILGDEVSFIADPDSQDLAVAAGAIVRADAVVDAAFLDRVPRLRVLARTGVGVDHVDLSAASAHGIPVIITPGSGTRAVAEGCTGHGVAPGQAISSIDRSGTPQSLGGAHEFLCR